MGATNCPETPRQKMITMMYLVYTAMLALNVSAEVVQGFKSVATATHQSNMIISAKLADTYENFDQALKNSPDKVREMYDRAQEIKKLSADLTNYIDSMEFSFIGAKVASKVDYKEPGTERKWEFVLRDESGNAINENVKAALDSLGFAWFTDKQLEDNHAPAQFFIGPDVKNPDPERGAIQIKNKIIEFKKKVNEALGEDSSHVKLNLNVDGGYNKEGDFVEWEVLNFNEVITGAALVTLTRLKAETMNAEYDAVNMLYKKVSKGDFTFDKVTLIARPTSGSYIVQGGTYETKIYIGAYNTKEDFTANVNGQAIHSENGIVTYKTVCNTVGPKKLNITALLKNPDGGVEEAKYEDEYFVATPAGSVQLDNMMVVYAGIDNPITVSGAGVDSRKINVSIEGGQADVRPAGEGNGQFIIKPAPGGKSKNLTISLDAQIDGKKTNLAKTKVRVKEIPAPQVKINGIGTGASISRKELAKSATITLDMGKDFLMKIDRKMLRILKMTVIVNKRPITVEGRTFTPEVMSAIKNATTGETLVLLTDVMMPDGNVTHPTFVTTLK